MAESFGILHVARFLQRLGLKVSHTDYPRNTIELAFHDNHGPWKMVVGIHQGGLTTKLMLVVPHFSTLTDDRRMECLEALMAVNYRIAIGKFGVDLTDGEIRLEESIPIAQDGLTFEQFQLAINALIQTVSIYHPLLSRIHYGDISAQDALHACEEEFFHAPAAKQEQQQEQQQVQLSLPTPTASTNETSSEQPAQKEADTELDVNEILAEVAWLLDTRKE